MANEQIRVEVLNLREVRKLMSKIAPDIKKSLDKANRELVKPLIGAAMRNFPDRPMNNWGEWFTPEGRDLSYDVAAARKGIKVKQRGRSKKSQYSSLMALRNETPAGAIFETAGRKTDSQFNDNLMRWYYVKKNGLTRGIWKAAIVDVGTGEIARQVEKNYQEAVDELQRRLDALN